MDGVELLKLYDEHGVLRIRDRGVKLEVRDKIELVQTIHALQWPCMIRCSAFTMADWREYGTSLQEENSSNYRSQGSMMGER